jgi:hypothetical protein
LMFFILTISVFFFLEKGNILLFLSSFSPWYGELSEESRYNHALFLAKEKRDFTGALSAISENNKLKTDTYELKADILVMLHKNEEALALYKEALLLSENSRIREKIDLITQTSKAKENKQTNTQTGKIIDEKLQELDKVQEERKNYMQPWNSQEVFDTLFSSLTGNIKDW